MDDLKNTIQNFFRNRYTRHEYFSVCREFERGVENEPFIEELESQWNEVDTNDPSNFDQKLTWNKIIGQIGTSIASKSTATVWYIVQKVAAILFLPILITALTLYFSANNRTGNNGWAEIKCPAGTRIEFQLPDGSTGFLNSKSKLKYPVNFKDNRNVHLTGEAFFEVVKNKKNKFTVTTGKLKAEVLGTSFNIMGYEDQPNEEITLKTGSLKILSKSNKQLSILSPDQQFVLDKEHNQFIKREVNALNYTSWISGKLIIQDERFEEVAKKLSKWYDVDIEIEDQKLKDFKYYATFEDEPLDEVLRLIVITAPIQYQEETRVRHADGSFSKRKIKFKTNENRIKDFN